MTLGIVASSHTLIYTTLHAIAFITAFIAAATYLVLYYFNRARQRSLVANMLLYLGIAQTLVYGSVLLRGLVLPRLDISDMVQDTISLLSNFAAASMTVWVLVAYLSVQRRARRVKREHDLYGVERRHHDRREEDRREEDRRQEDREARRDKADRDAQGSL